MSSALANRDEAIRTMGSRSQAHSSSSLPGLLQPDPGSSGSGGQGTHGLLHVQAVTIVIFLLPIIIIIIAPSLKLTPLHITHPPCFPCVCGGGAPWGCLARGWEKRTRCISVRRKLSSPTPPHTSCHSLSGATGWGPFPPPASARAISPDTSPAGLDTITGRLPRTTAQRVPQPGCPHFPGTPAAPASLPSPRPPPN